MGIFRRSQQAGPLTASQQPECTAAAVAEFLAGAGFSMSEPDGDGVRTAGLYAEDLTLPEPRVAVHSHPAFSPKLTSMVIMYLAECGYRAWRVQDASGEYLMAGPGGA